MRACVCVCVCACACACVFGVLTLGSGGNNALLSLYMLSRLTCMLVFVKRSSWKLVELSFGQMSLSPENGETVMVFFSSDWGRLSLIPPST